MKIPPSATLSAHEAYFEENPTSNELEDMERALRAAISHLALAGLGLRVKELGWKPSFRGVHVSEPFPGIIYRVWENGFGTYQMYSPNVDENASVYGVTYKDIGAAKIAAQNEWNTIALTRFFEVDETIKEATPNESYRNSSVEELDKAMMEGRWRHNIPGVDGYDPTIGTRPAAPVEGLETVLYQFLDGCWIACHKPTDGGLRNIGHIDQEYVVTRSQAEAIIAAKDESIKDAKLSRDDWKKLAKDIQADNAALTARVKELEADVSAYILSAEDQDKRRKALETQLAAANGALRICLEAEKERRKKLKPGAPATTYTDKRIAMINAALKGVEP